MDDLDPDKIRVTADLLGGASEAPLRRALSPVAIKPMDVINLGGLDGKPVAPAKTPLESLLLSMFKMLKQLTKDNCSESDRRSVHALIEQLTTRDLQHACNDISTRAATAVHTMPSPHIKKVAPPMIRDDAHDRITPEASKDFNLRINHGTFSSLQKHTVTMRDLLSSATEVAETHNLNVRGVISLLRRSMREPARSFMEHLIDSNLTLPKLYSELLEYYSPRLAAAEAARRLGELLSKPISDLDEFLSDVMSLAIQSQQSLSANMQGTAGQLLAVSNLLDYVGKHHPTVFAIVSHELTKSQTVNPSMEPSDVLLSLMRLLRMHRVSLEHGGRRHHRISEIITPAGQMSQGQSAATSQGVAPYLPQGPTAPPLPSHSEPTISHIHREQQMPERPNNAATTEGRIEELTQQIGHLHQLIQGTWTGQQQVPHTSYPVEAIGATPWAPSLPRMLKPQAMAPRNLVDYRPLNMALRPPGANFTPMGPRPQNGQPGPSWTPQRPRQLPNDVYTRHFSGGQCFRCNLTGHSFRQCPHISEGTLASTPCHDCQAHGIMAYHISCGGRIARLHKGSPGGQVTTPQIEELQFYQGVYPEESGPVAVNAPGPVAHTSYTAQGWPAQE
jgi:hypothetical protein